MVNGWRVAAADIANWAETSPREAQENLPLLVQKLVFASVNPHSLRIPTGDSVINRGWDGILNVESGNAYVPNGISAWELSTGKDVQGKAELDYGKRLTNPLGIDKNNSTFVFVTCRKWLNSDSWVVSKKLHRQWADVKVLDAENLDSWLKLCPSVHRWFAVLIGKLPQGAWTIEQGWGSWSCGTKPAGSADLVIAGRFNAEQKLAELLNRDPSDIVVAAEWGEEAYAFVLSVVGKHAKFSSRLLVVKDEKEWDSIIDTHSSLILIPQIDNLTSVGYAVKRGHWIILPVSSSKLTAPPQISLGKPDRNQQINALVAMGISKKKAEKIVYASRGYLSVIRRHPVLVSGSYQRPSWSMPENTQFSIPALFAGSWMTDNENDRAILAALANLSYDGLENALHMWVLTGDPLAERIGNMWRIVSYRDAWSLLCPYVTSALFERFCKASADVLNEPDPRFELPLEDRWMANAYGKVTNHSTSLRHGISTMLALLGARGDIDCKVKSAYSVQDRISSSVRQVLRKDMSEKAWYSISQEIAMLAEAAPDVFIDTVESDLKKDKPPIMSLFVDEGTMGGCPHAELLRALELTSWNLDYLSRIVGILSKLARLDPGSRYMNRPFNSLKAIFQGCLPQTKAPLDDRIRIIDRLIGVEPEVGWKLLVGLIPEIGVLSEIQKPRFREWAKGWKKGVTQKDYEKHIVIISERLLSHAIEGPLSRWIDLTKELPNLPQVVLDKTLAELKEKGTTFPEPVKDQICTELRTLITRHREFSNATWALPKVCVDQLEELYQRLLSNDLLDKSIYLFNSYIPDLIHARPDLDYTLKIQMSEKERIAALELIWTNLGFQGIQQLALKVKLPQILGNSVGNCSFGDHIERQVLSWLDNGNNSLVQTAMGYVNARYTEKNEWGISARTQYGNNWSDKTWSTFCLSLPLTRFLLELLETLNQNVQTSFWESISNYYLREQDAECVNVVLGRLLSKNRPFAAINAADLYLHNPALKKPLSHDLLGRALELALIKPSDLLIAGPTTGYQMSEILKELQLVPDFDENRLARIEWMYLPLMRSWDIQPVKLVDRLTKDPEFFVEIICLMYHGKPPIEGEFPNFSPELKKQLSLGSWHLLKLLERLPSQISPGEIDSQKLQEWVEAARAGCKQKNRQEVGDAYIGDMLSHSPTGKDGIWPHEAIRAIIESVDSKELEEGVETGRENQRGVVARAFGEGGKQEREIAETYERDARRIKYDWPRTALMLFRIAEDYKRLAIFWDKKDGIISN